MRIADENVGVASYSLLDQTAQAANSPSFVCGNCHDPSALTENRMVLCSQRLAHRTPV
jgi:hypothetical protein